MQRFKDKVVIVTGGASGIGKETAMQFGKEGAKVILADINSNLGSQAAEELKAQGCKAKFIKTDVSLAGECQQLMEETEKFFGTIDVLFNNAGIEISGPMIDFSEEDFDSLMATNLKSVFLCSKYALKKMVQKKSGVIVNTASVASFLAWPDDVVYSTTKAGVKMLTKAMALEYANSAIRVNAVAPGIIDTPMTDRALSKYTNKEEIKIEKGKVQPLGRLGKPCEVARAVLFLSSDEASFITGVILPVDGGYLTG